jgi:hypothetical protein
MRVCETRIFKHKYDTQDTFGILRIFRKFDRTTETEQVRQSVERVKQRGAQKKKTI